MDERIREQWESNAEAFSSLIDGEGTPHHRKILNPCVARLLGEVAGRKLLDAGSGEGYLARYYAKKGADVTAIDLSQRLIETSEQMSKSEGVIVDYRVDNVCYIESVPKEEFDIVLSNLVLQNIPYLDDAINEFHRVLKTGGVLVFSIIHPAFNYYGPGSWEMGKKNPETKRREGLYFKVDRYFEEEEYERYWKTKEGEKFPETISFFHRTLSTYLNALSRAGFHLLEFAEPQPIDDDQFFDRERRIPFFGVFKAQKI
ncbi:MAG: class I SAM-dependent methyltransferase [Candidatus Thorarchaeota archaeon]|jgi:2-polyprenyl-3-methyl-5-hydroxy-6-metoxy-1,4-benzoquinol methylase